MISYQLWYRNEKSGLEFSGSSTFEDKESAEVIADGMRRNFKELYDIEVIKVQHVERRTRIRLVTG